MTTIPFSDTRLQSTMIDLEAALLTPVVAGELADWVASVQKAAATFNTDFVRCVRSDLHPKYREIAKTDNDLMSHVQQLLKTDHELFEAMASFQDDAAALRQLAEVAGQEEVRVVEYQQDLEKNGLNLIMRIKKQHVAVATWLDEAHCRDRGVGD
ncbi:MAG: hypothetical protein AB7O62_21640 [Pirellulales bacterium]